MKKNAFQKALIKTCAILLGILFLATGCSVKTDLIDPQTSAITADNATETFQEYLWINNPVVLLLQIALMLAGAIGVIVLLPAPYEEEIE